MRISAGSVCGVVDHVHLLIGLRVTHCLADVVGSVKSVSSGWVHDEICERGFLWQEGYGGFTVSPQQCAHVCGYIARLEEHHHKQSFQEEYLEFLRLGRRGIR